MFIAGVANDAEPTIPLDMREKPRWPVISNVRHIPWDVDSGKQRGRESLFVAVHAENLSGPSGFLDAWVEPLPAAIQNAPVSVPSSVLNG